MESALIGILGVLVGILLNEAIRRQRRIEDFGLRVFDKRLKIYEELYTRIDKTAEIAHIVIEEAGHSNEDRHAMMSEGILALTGFCDRNAMYLNEELALHAMATFVGAEDIFKMNPAAKKRALEKYREDVLAAKRMVRKESGIMDIEKHFTSITQAKHSSPLIEYYRELKRKQDDK
ncbi:MAG: hypothetical protein WCU88_10090 [Elusimicrobiota bacterium]|jgi:hypothetical protein